MWSCPFLEIDIISVFGICLRAPTRHEECTVFTTTVCRLLSLHVSVYLNIYSYEQSRLSSASLGSARQFLSFSQSAAAFRTAFASTYSRLSRARYNSIETDYGTPIPSDCNNSTLHFSQAVPIPSNSNLHFSTSATRFQALSAWSSHSSNRAFFVKEAKRQRNGYHSLSMSHER